MHKEIKRNQWSRFCRKFSSDNRYRRVTVRLAGGDWNAGQRHFDLRFMGLSLERKGRVINGLRLLAFQPDPRNISQPVLSLNQPAGLFAEQDVNGNDMRLTVHTGDGLKAEIELGGAVDNTSVQDCVRQLAYSLYEQRGGGHSQDQGDWYEAERRVRETEAAFTV